MMTIFCSYFTKILKANQLYRRYIITMSIEEMQNDAKKIFYASVESVQPDKLINTTVKVGSNVAEIQGNEIYMSRNVHVVGFGKAVLGMARALENKLKEKILSGIISVPDGILNSLSKISSLDNSSCIQVCEGGHNNIPDENSQLAANKISELVSSLSETDLLFVLISGGGSALLPSPKPPITLSEKLLTIKLLASKGASIEELNSVRKKLSTLKGGGLAKLAYPTKTVSLILSDIVGDPISSIASGPTVENTDDPRLPLTIIEKYNLKSELPENVLKLIQNINEPESNHQNFSHVTNYIIGNNKLALEAAALAAQKLNYVPYILTDVLVGKAKNVGTKLISLINAALEYKIELVNQIGNELGFPEKALAILLESTSKIKSSDCKLCLLFGGETTVEVQGSGLGGRNQELALAAAIQLKAEQPKKTIVLLSAGTDGIDGPTDAAGAIATALSMELAETENLNAAEYLDNNDSYNFYKKVFNGLFHVKTGHTGTNVMDVIIILVN